MNLLSEAIQLLAGEQTIEQTSVQLIKYRGYIKEDLGQQITISPVSLKAVAGQFITLRMRSNDPKPKRIRRCKVVEFKKGISMSGFSTSCDDEGVSKYYLAFYVPFPGNSFIVLKNSKTRIFRLLNINEMGPKRIKGNGVLLRAPLLDVRPAILLDLCGTRGSGNSMMQIRMVSYVHPTNGFRGFSVPIGRLTLTVPRRMAREYLNNLKIKHNMKPEVLVDTDNESDTATFTQFQRFFLISWSDGWISDMENCDVFPPVASMCSSMSAPMEVNSDEPYEGLFEQKDDMKIQKEWVLRSNELGISLMVLGDHFSQRLSQCVD